VEAVAGLARFDAGGEGKEPTVSDMAFEALEKGHGALQEDDVSLICAALDARIQHTGIVGAACRAFSALACDQKMAPNPRAQATIVQEGGLTKVLEAMVVHAADSSVQEHGSWALCTIARRHLTNSKLMVQGLDHAVPQAVKYAMDSNLESLQLQEKACAALRALCDGGEGNQVVLLEEGLITTLCHVMRTQADSAAVQRQACSCVVALAEDKQAREAMWQKDSPGNLVGLVRLAMRNHIDSTGVVEQAVAALAGIALDEGGRVAIAEEGCIDQTREVMVAHKYHPGLQQICVQLLANIAISPANQPLIVEASCLELVLEAQKNFTSAGGLQEQVILALGAFVNGSAESKQHAINVGAFMSLRNGLQHHRLDPAVNEAVCRFMVYFIVDKMLVRATQFKAVLVNEGFIRDLCDIMTNCPTSAGVQEWACRVIHNVAARSSEHKAALVASGTISLVCAAVQHHPQNTEVLTQAFAVLLSLSVERAVAPILMRNGCIALLREAMRMHTAHVKIQQDCIWTLLNVVWSDEECQESVRQHGIVPFILEARIRYGPVSATLDSKAAELLKRIDPDGTLASGGRFMPPQSPASPSSKKTPRKTPRGDSEAEAANSPPGRDRKITAINSPETAAGGTFSDPNAIASPAAGVGEDSPPRI